MAQCCRGQDLHREFDVGNIEIDARLGAGEIVDAYPGTIIAIGWQFLFSRIGNGANNACRTVEGVVFIGRKGQCIQQW